MNSFLDSIVIYYYIIQKFCFCKNNRVKSELKLEEIDENLFDYQSEFQTKKHNPKLKKGEKIYSSQISENIFNLFQLSNKENINNNNKKLYNLSELIPYTLNSSIFFSEEEIKNLKKLKIESDDLDNEKDDDLDLFYGKILIMNAGGLEKGKRNLKDGYAFFGTIEIINNIIINDFILNYHNTENISTLFYIHFDKNTLKYNLTPQDNDNEKIFVKLNKNYIIKEKTLFSIANILFSIEIIENNEMKLIIYFEGGKQEKTLQKNKGYYTIGRKKINDFVMRIPVISKIHCFIFYQRENDIWIISDGDFKNKKKSTNGIWKNIKSKFEMEDKITYFNLGVHNFKCTLID